VGGEHGNIGMVVEHVLGCTRADYQLRDNIDHLCSVTAWLQPVALGFD